MDDSEVEADMQTVPVKEVNRRSPVLLPTIVLEPDPVTLVPEEQGGGEEEADDSLDDVPLIGVPLMMPDEVVWFGVVDTMTNREVSR